MRANLFLSLVAAIALGSVAQAQSPPRVLIGQYTVLSDDRIDITLRVAAELARELDTTGQVEPIVWSMTDPNFRQIAIQNNLPERLQFPLPNTVAELSRTVSFDYYLEITAAKDAAGTRPIVRLYPARSSRPVWEFGTVRGQRYLPDVMFNGEVDSRRSRQVSEQLMAESGQGLNGLVILVDGLPDYSSLSSTLARTWAKLLEETAFKDLPRRPRMDTPDLGQGYLITTQGIQIRSGDADQTLAEVEQKLQNGQTDLAVVLLRDAIDAHPLDHRLRTSLTQILLDQEFYDQAAAEAERAARLQIDLADSWLVAARAWLYAQNPEAAQNALNQALARGAQSMVSNSLMGEVYLLQGEYTKAIEQFTLSIDQGPRPEALIGRAMAYAMSGKPEECSKDLQALIDIDPETSRNAYLQAVQLADIRFDTLAVQIRELLPLIRVSSGAAEHTARIASIELATRSLAELISNIPVPDKFQESHQARSLAHLLLTQSASEALEFAKGGDSALGDEALLSLGEALKLMPGVRQAFRVEKMVL